MSADPCINFNEQKKILKIKLYHQNGYSKVLSCYRCFGSNVIPSCTVHSLLTSINYVILVLIFQNTYSAVSKNPSERFSFMLQLILYKSREFLPHAVRPKQNPASMGGVLFCERRTKKIFLGFFVWS